MAKEKFAIVKLNNNQYKVKEGNTIEVQKISGKAGDKVEFDSVLLHVDGEKVTVGKPSVEKATVSAEIVEHIKGPKVQKVTYKAKSRYRRKVGHRQNLTKIKINKIS